MIRGILIAVTALSLSGCAWIGGWFGGKDNSEPPTPLTEITEEIRPQEMWSRSAGAGSGERRLALRPAVAGEFVYAAGRKGEVSAVRLDNGEQVWEVDLKAPISAGPGYGDGLVLLGTTDARVFALRADNGERLWEAKVSTEVMAAPQAAEGVVAVHTVDGRITGLSSGDGQRLWTYDRSAPVLTLRGTSAPALAGGLVVAGFDSGHTAALTARDGRVLWERSIAIPSGRSELERLVDIDANPVIVDDVVYVTTFQGRIAALSLERGELLWAREMSSYAALDVGETQVFVTDDIGQVWALDRRTGATFWKQDKLRHRAVSGPVVIGDYVVVGDLEGYLHWLSRDDGRFVGRTRADSSGIVSQPVVVDGAVVALSNEGEISAWRLPQSTP